MLPDLLHDNIEQNSDENNRVENNRVENNRTPVNLEAPVLDQGFHNHEVPPAPRLDPLDFEGEDNEGEFPEPNGLFFARDPMPLPDSYSEIPSSPLLFPRIYRRNVPVR